MKSLDAHGISARFDPWGVFVRQWRFTDVHVQSGDVAIQIYQANPEAVKPKPWFAIFLPNRVYVQRIESEQANVTWHFVVRRPAFSAPVCSLHHTARILNMSPRAAG